MKLDSEMCQGDDAVVTGGVRPAKQARSRRTRRRLLAAGRALLKSADFDAVTIADLARRARCSVGSFYARFEDKDSFLRALVADMLTETECAELDLLAKTADARVVGAVVGFAVGSYRRDAGLIRAAMRKGMADPAAWEPFRRYGRAAAARLLARLARAAGRPLGETERLRIRIASQTLYGTLNNMLLHRPGPLQLESSRLERELARAFRLVAFGSSNTRRRGRRIKRPVVGARRPDAG
jgi:AcrR family transcriptional regulator